MKMEDLKQNDQEYLFYMQKFLDITENINDEILQKEIIGTMLKCDERLTKLADIEIKKLNKIKEEIE